MDKCTFLKASKENGELVLRIACTHDSAAIQVSYINSASSKIKVGAVLLHLYCYGVHVTVTAKWDSTFPPLLKLFQMYVCPCPTEQLTGSFCAIFLCCFYLGKYP